MTLQLSFIPASVSTSWGVRRLWIRFAQMVLLSLTSFTPPHPQGILNIPSQDLVYQSCTLKSVSMTSSFRKQKLFLNLVVWNQTHGIYFPKPALGKLEGAETSWFEDSWLIVLHRDESERQAPSLASPPVLFQAAWPTACPVRHLQMSLRSDALGSSNQNWSWARKPRSHPRVLAWKTLCWGPRWPTWMEGPGSILARYRTVLKFFQLFTSTC